MGTALLVISSPSPTGKVTGYKYEALLAKVADPNSKETLYGYDPTGGVSSVAPKAPGCYDTLGR
jgi:uncharacterized protein RhaS with RHS repeats